ncbi:unnamed protein product, partial [Phaeothamnion confervicola]
TGEAVKVKSPGMPPSPITLAQLQAFNAPMLSRNCKLQYALSGTKLVKGRGLGMKTLGAMAGRYRLPLPQYSFDGIYLTLTLYRHPSGAVQALDARVRDALAPQEKPAWQFISTRQTVTSADLMSALAADERKAQRVLKKLMSAGLLRRVGKGPATHYEVVRQGRVPTVCRD